jgi:DivIVA domain-containing protein
LLIDWDDPEKRIAELQRQQADANAVPGPPPSRPVRGGLMSTARSELTADDVHNVAFSTPPTGRRGYEEAEVEAFRRRLEEHLRNPQAVDGLTAAEVDSVAFSKAAMGKRGYDQHEVDAFLDRVGQQLKRTNGLFAPHLKPDVGPEPGFPAATGGFRGHTSSRPERRGDRIATWMIAIFFVGASLIPLGIGVHHVYGYLAGTPTTATIVGCRASIRSIHKTCWATWDVDGESHTGTIEGGIGGHRPGSSLDVHVRGSSAYMATSGYLYFGVAAGPSIIAVVMLFGLWRIRQPGAVAAPGRHSRS